MSNDKKQLIQELDNDFVTVATEDAVEVQFVDVEARTHHKAGEDIFVVYEICEGYKPSSRDWIGLYADGVLEVKQYMNFQWAPRHPRDDTFPRIRGVLFPAGEVDISPSATNKYFFMYISKANQILAKSQKFYICDFDPEKDLDLECVDNHFGDLHDFTLVKANTEKEKDDDTLKGWVKTVTDHVTLKSDLDAGRTLLEVFENSEDKAVVPYCGSGPMVLYDANNNHFAKRVAEILPKSPVVKETVDQAVDLEALRVELDYVENNLDQQKKLVSELSTKVTSLEEENLSLSRTNQKLHHNLRDLTNKKEAVETEVNKCNSRIEELQTIVRLQKKGNKALELECRLAIEAAKRSEIAAEQLRIELRALEERKAELEENLAQGLDANGNALTEPPMVDENEEWSVATSRKTEKRQKTIEKLETALSEEKERCKKLSSKLKESEKLAGQLGSDVNEHERDGRNLLKQLCAEKSVSHDLKERVSELSGEMGRMSDENERLTQQVAAVKRQKERVKRHLVERERELASRVQALEDAVKEARTITKLVKRQCENSSSQTSLKTSDVVTQTASKRTADQACLTAVRREVVPERPSTHPREATLVNGLGKKQKKSTPWEEYFDQFKSVFWTENEKSTEAKNVRKDSRKQGGETFRKPQFSYQDNLFPFAVFPSVDVEDETINQNSLEEPVDLTMKRSAHESPCSGSPTRTSSSEASASSDDSSGSWDQQVDEESAELLPLCSGIQLSTRQKKKPSAFKTTAYVTSKQPKPRAFPLRVHDNVEAVSPPTTRTERSRKPSRKFVCHSRRLRFPVGSSSSKGSHVSKGSSK